MKVISRMVIKMPTDKNSTRIRYEIELVKKEKLYHVIRYQYVSKYLHKVTLIVVTKDKQTAINFYNKELLMFTSVL